MPCFSPLTAWRSRDTGPSGKRLITFDRRDSVGFEIKFSCGQCIGCRLEYSRQWAMRIMHESSMHEENCFITLTYGEDELPSDGSLRKDHFQDFIKRLRSRNPGRVIRYFHCGEYGEVCVYCRLSEIKCECPVFKATFGRPHYHACLFGFEFNDKVLYKERDGVRLYASAALMEIWKQGFCSIGELTFDSAAYVARYVMKRVTGDRAADHYMDINLVTGELNDLEPEYSTMSRRPGIGSSYFDSFTGDMYPCDSVAVNGLLCKPPRYYDNLYDVVDPEGLEAVKVRRVKRGYRHKADSTPRRLLDREIVKQAQIGNLKRSL